MMLNLSLLVSPLAKGAYFANILEVAQAELQTLIGDRPYQMQPRAGLDFIDLEADENSLSALAQLSFVQGIFLNQGESLVPLAADKHFRLHDDFVFGSKFKGKTNEILTQLLINVGLNQLNKPTEKLTEATVSKQKKSDKIKLLDPMCGRATTLLWAMRYGLMAKGIEQDPKALGDIRQNLKKWTKLHRQKHQLNEGFIGKANKQDKGKFLEFAAEDTSMRVISGNSTDTAQWLKGEKFHLIISDLPYGVQHFTTDKTRNPLATLTDCAPGWADSLKPGGVMVLAYNRYIPKREQLIDVFAQQGLEPVPFEASHRMSESIVRDIVVFKK